jgi:ribosomal protein S18 acetylase RimI-like enzyme
MDIQDIQLVPAKEADKDFLLHLRLQTMVEHLEASGQYLTRDEHALRVAHEYQHSHLIKINHQIVGLLKYKEDQQKVTIIQLQIAPEFQNKGYGSMVVNHVISQSQGKTVSLSVLKANPAFKLYLKLGFCQVGEDEHEYYLQT